MIGDYAYPCHIETLVEMKKTNPFSMKVPENIGDISDALDVKTVLEGIKQKMPAGSKVIFAEGCKINGSSKKGFREAVEAAKKADAAVVVVGDKSGPLLDCTVGEARDVSSLKLPGVQGELVCEIIETGKPVVIVLISGRPYEMNTENEKAEAILAAWLPGEEGGNAVADILFGNANPGGKLPVSFPRSAGQAPLYYSHKPSGGRSHWMGDYVNESSSPLYPFGYGLSYTDFNYKNLKLDKTEVPLNGAVNIEFDLKNTGKTGGDEIVQLYVHYMPSECLVTRPVRELKGFKRISLDPGETKRIIFTLYVHQLAFYNENMSYVINPGAAEVMIGSSSEDIRLSGTFNITGNKSEIVKKKVFFSGVSVE
jgi:beta-glucosidase